MLDLVFSLLFMILKYIIFVIDLTVEYHGSVLHSQNRTLF